MTSAEVHAVVALVLGLLVAFPALALLLRALAPGAAEGAERQARERPLRSLLAGVAVVGPGLVLVAALGKLPGGGGKAASGLALAALFLLAYVGVAGLAAHVGARLPSPGDAARPWLATLRGAVVLECACGLPLLGWFVLAPLALITGAGATTIGLFSRAAATAHASASTPVATPEPVSVS